MFTEKSLVEDYFIQKLEEKGWNFIQADDLERESLEEPLLTPILIRALERIKDNICSWWDYHRDLQEIEDMAIQYMRKIKEIFALYGEMEKREIPKIKDTRIPIRTNKLFDLEGQLSPLKYDKIERWWRIKELIPRIKYYPIIDIILFKIDGKKTVSQIIKEVYYEFNFQRPEAIEELLEFFRELGLIEFKPHKKLEKN